MPVPVAGLLAQGVRLGIMESLPGWRRPLRQAVLWTGDDLPGAARPLRQGTVLVLSAETAFPQEPLREKAPAGSRWGGVGCFAVAGTARVPEALRRAASVNGIAVFASRLPADLLYSRLVGLLRAFGERIVVVHGTLVDKVGHGVLLVGSPGTGKTTSAMALVSRGFRWVADDAVVLRRCGGVLYGSSHPRIRRLVAVRGRGILDAAKLFGTVALCERTRVEAVIELVWKGQRAEPGAAETFPYAVLGLSLPGRRLEMEDDAKHQAARIEGLLQNWGHHGLERGAAG